MLRTGLADFPPVTKGQLKELQKILDEEIPRLRRFASPSHNGSTKTDNWR